MQKKSEVSIDSIRFYERRGLLTEPLRTESNYRVYPLETVNQLRFFKKAQTLGFTLDEIKEFLTLQHGLTAFKSDVKAKTTENVKNIREKIQALTQMLKALEPLDETCDGHGPTEECQTLAALAADDGSHECHHYHERGDL